MLILPTGDFLSANTTGITWTSLQLKDSFVNNIWVNTSLWHFSIVSTNNNEVLRILQGDIALRLELDKRQKTVCHRELRICDACRACLWLLTLMLIPCQIVQKTLWKDINHPDVVMSNMNAQMCIQSSADYVEMCIVLLNILTRTSLQLWLCHVRHKLNLPSDEALPDISLRTTIKQPDPSIIDSPCSLDKITEQLW